jgi:hypothetical protein
MYYPKSQIKTNLRAKEGEFVLANTKAPYRGYYYMTSNGEVYSGKTPSDSTTQLLQLSSNSPSFIFNDPDPEQGKAGSLSNDASFFSLPLPYVVSTNLNFSIAPLAPQQTYPTPTENDYKLGEFQRYFIKKGNESKFLEISLEDYRKYVSKDKDVMFELYIPFQINWILTGEKKQVYKVNQSIVTRAEREQNLPGFTQYFRDRFTQFYKYIEASNLYTAGNEFKTEKGVNYIGFYHIHDSKGPMVGKTHIEDPHEYLFPINETIISRTQNPTPNFIPQNNVTITQSIYTPSNISMGGGGGGGGGGGY